MKAIVKQLHGQYICSQFCKFRKLHFCTKYNEVCLSCDFHEQLKNIDLKHQADIHNEIKSQLACLDCIMAEVENV